MTPDWELASLLCRDLGLPEHAIADVAARIRGYGAACAAEMRETCARMADQKRLGSYDAREIAAAIRALPLAPELKGHRP